MTSVAKFCHHRCLQALLTSLCAVIAIFLFVILMTRSLVQYQYNTVYSQPEVASRHDKWVVVTSSDLPPEVASARCEVPGWRVLIVETTDMSQQFKSPYCIYLSVETQTQLRYRSAQGVSTPHYNRKNIGYLYAIAHGAQVIYDTDNIASFPSRLEDADTYSSTDTYSSAWSGLVYSGDSDTFNPYVHFGAATLQPRGLPDRTQGGPQTSYYR